MLTWAIRRQRCSPIMGMSVLLDAAVCHTVVTWHRPPPGQSAGNISRNPRRIPALFLVLTSKLLPPRKLLMNHTCYVPLQNTGSGATAPHKNKVWTTLTVSLLDSVSRSEGRPLFYAWGEIKFTSHKRKQFLHLQAAWQGLGERFSSLWHNDPNQLICCVLPLDEVASLSLCWVWTHASTLSGSQVHEMSNITTLAAPPE